MADKINIPNGLFLSFMIKFMINSEAVFMFFSGKGSFLLFLNGGPAFHSYPTGLNHRPVSASIGFKNLERSIETEISPIYQIFKTV